MRHQNLNERIAKLKAHLKTRRGRRDFAALRRLVDMQRALAGHKPTSMYSMQELLKNVYTDENVLPGTAFVFAPNPIFKLFKKDL